MSDPAHERSHWRWVKDDVVLAIHDALIAEHGGLAGMRDRALVNAALARPRHRAAFATPDLADLAAAYAYELLRNHGFLDGNKRVTLVVATVFLLDHGYDLGASDAETVAVMITAAAGEMTESELAAWIRAMLVPKN